jgi:hypothetical protein
VIPFISRHIPTAAQQATVRDHFGDLVCPDPVVFEPGRVVEQVNAALVAVVVRRLGERFGPHDLIVPAPAHDHGDEARYLDELAACQTYRVAAELHREFCVQRVVAGVFPGWALLELVRAGWAVVELQNEPGARDRGAFVCRGAFVHTLAASDFLACPVSVAEQEDGPLLAGLRSALSAP